jgi:putative membrane protein
MECSLALSLKGLPGFLLYFGVSLALLLIFCAVYGWLTPCPELRLIRHGKVAPAISFGGALLGFVIPLASAVSHSVGIADMVLWALIAMAAQIAVFFGMKLVFRDLILVIAKDGVAEAAFVAFCSVAVGILNAAAMTY